MQHRTVEMCSTPKLNCVDLQWTVKQWRRVDNACKSLQSDSFKLHGGDSYLLFNHDECIEHKKELMISLHDCVEHKKVTARVFVLVKDQEKHELKSKNKTPLQRKQDWDGEIWQYSYQQIFIVNETVLNKSNENLIFYVELAYVENSPEASIDISRYWVIEKLQRLMLDDYCRINANQEPLPQDIITFLIGNMKLEAHSLILGAASTYFSAMFRHKDFKENKERTINLTDDNDVTPENFQIFLDIIYGRKKIQDIEQKFLQPLCILTDKYSVKELLEACEFFLSRTITVENVNELIIFADKYNCKSLKSKAMIYAKENINVIKQMSTFDNIYNNKPLLLELL